MTLSTQLPLATADSITTPSVALRKLNNQILTRGLQNIHNPTRDPHASLQTASNREGGMPCAAQRTQHNTPQHNRPSFLRRYRILIRVDDLYDTIQYLPLRPARTRPGTTRLSTEHNAPLSYESSIDNDRGETSRLPSRTQDVT